MCAAKCTMGLKPRALKNMYLSFIESTILYAVPVWIAALNKKYIVRMLSSVQRLSLILITKSFRTAQTDILQALAGVLPIDLRAKELTTMCYAKKGRPEYWPELSTPAIPISRRTKLHSDFIESHVRDEIIKVFLDVQSDDSSPPFPLARRKLKIALYEKWHQGFTNRDFDKITTSAGILLTGDGNEINMSHLYKEAN
ncbi:hypothetical protein QYM36_008316 [Artemia franciscana]|uniref:Uncharacterized protein n=1 Tax=Artemia franciscana TaxID=6661 RepID=A0AA88LEN7_ARTSF|nr:hypothetical protein QYM36_008316 [Artemia franciscana]